MSLMDKVEIPQRSKIWFFVVDCSGSMEGEKIAALRSAIENSCRHLVAVSNDSPDIEPKIAVLAFSTGCRWLTPEGAVAFAPVIILLTDGEPADDWSRGLETLKENKWFQASIKVAIALGDDANKDILTAFAGNVGAVFEVRNAATLEKLMEFVSVHTSRLCAHPAGYDEQEGLNTILREYVTAIDDGGEW